MSKEETEIATVEQEKGKFSIITSPNSSFMNPAVYMQAKYIAQDMMKDGALPRGFTSAGQAVMAMQAGAMMDMNWVESLQSLYFVNGSINIWGKAVPNRLRKHGYKFEFVSEDQTHCKARVWKEDEGGKIVEEYTEDFLYADAVKSGYTSGSSGIKIGWKEGINRIKKMRYNVLSLIISTYIPDVLGPTSGIVEVTQDYMESEPKGDIESTIDNALKVRKKEKMEIIEPDEKETIVAELHIESDGDKTVEATTGKIEPLPRKPKEEIKDETVTARD